MKIYEKALPPKLISECYNELCSLIESNVWISSIAWPEYLRRYYIGRVIQTNLSKKLMTKVNEVLYEKYFASYGDDLTLHYQYYIWDKLSGIDMHNDSGHNFGATLYLNGQWNPNWGGLFVWEDKDEKNLKTICPKQNTLVITDGGEDHMVTTISPYAEEDRITIQIWVNKKNFNMYKTKQ